ncbi:hypothetical protein [Nostoc sp. C117]|uniref:hypothetical protein n=1 Tax=Nostoc sp. C117 TaxID=3349875 RepID=UPI00370D3FAA
MLAHAQKLVYTLKELMPTQYQKDNLEAMLALFLEAQGQPLPEHSQIKSPHIVVYLLLFNIERLTHLARSSGFDIHISRCKI